MLEATLTAAFCAAVGGVTEVRHDYDHGYIRTDCETTEHVIEAGLDKRSSLDSIQQAVFAHTLTGKIPVVVIYDTDGNEGKWQFRIREAAEALNVPYIVVDATDPKRPIALPECSISTPSICRWKL